MSPHQITAGSDRGACTITPTDRIQRERERERERERCPTSGGGAAGPTSVYNRQTTNTRQHSLRMMHTASLFSLVLLLVVRGGRAACAPDCSGTESGDSVRDPTDCTRYYVCLNIGGEMQVSDPVYCQPGYYFNADHTEPRCDPIDGAPPDFCSNLCDPCVVACTENNPGTMQPNPFNCSLSHVCLVSGPPLDEKCPESEPYFDYLTSLCQTDETRCYDFCDPCVPRCIEQGQVVPDPLDCHRFYLCSPPDMTGFDCPSGEVFNPDTSNCEAAYPCNTIC